MTSRRFLSAVAACAAMVPAVALASTVQAGDASAVTNACAAITVTGNASDWTAIGGRNCGDDFIGQIRITSPAGRSTSPDGRGPAQRFVVRGKGSGYFCSETLEKSFSGFVNRGSACTYLAPLR